MPICSARGCGTTSTLKVLALGEPIATAKPVRIRDVYTDQSFARISRKSSA